MHLQIHWLISSKYSRVHICNLYYIDLAKPALKEAENNVP